jgi:hypothetical protein
MPNTTNPQAPALTTFQVEVCRTSVSFNTIEVQATNEFEAQQLALDEAGNHSYSEKDAEYSLPFEVPNPALVAKRAQTIDLLLGMTCAGDVLEPVIGAKMVMSYADLESIQSIAKGVVALNLSEARAWQGVSEWLYREGYEEQESPHIAEISVEKSGFFLTGGIEHTSDSMRSRLIDLAWLDSLFTAGVKKVVMLADMTHPLEFLSEIGHATEDLDVEGDIRIWTPVGDFTRDDYQAALAANQRPREA